MKNPKLNKVSELHTPGDINRKQLDTRGHATKSTHLPITAFSAGIDLKSHDHPH